MAQATPASPPLSPVGPPLSIDLQEAIRLARTYNQQFLTSGIGVAIAQESRKQAKAALLPNVSAINQYIFTQPNNTDTAVYLANNGVHEFIEQANVHGEVFSVTKQAVYRRSLVAEATARARVDVATRGLIVVVAQRYYTLVLAQRHLLNARTSLDEARQFETLSQRQEQGGEVAHSDVIKAQLQTRQRERELVEAQAGVDKAAVDLAVLLFADVTQQFTVVDDIVMEIPLPGDAKSMQQSVLSNPDVRTAESNVREAEFGVKAARGEFFPTISVDYFFGIDANVFKIHGPDGRQNVGSSVATSVTVPVFNWGATRSRVREAQLQQQQAQVDLNATRRQAQADVTTQYLELRAAQAQLQSLRDSVNAAAESLRLTNLRYQGGEATALEVVDAQNTAVLARDALDTGLARARVATVNLQVLTGTF